MTESEFIGHASGQTYSDALNNRVRPATPEVVRAIRELERIKFALRERISGLFPATASWRFWDRYPDALARIYQSTSVDWDVL
jgi:hypothetical protein